MPCTRSLQEMRAQRYLHARIHPATLALITDGMVTCYPGIESLGQHAALREFLTRNGHPHTYIDLDNDTTAQELSIVSTEDRRIPCDLQRKSVMRNPTTQHLLNAWDSRAQWMNHAFRCGHRGAGPAGWRRRFTPL